jgi:flagellar biosynthetic protein FlhB
VAEGAEDRTEAASARRLQRAQEEGDVPVAREFALLAGLAGGVACVAAQIAADRQAPLRWFAAALSHSNAASPEFLDNAVGTILRTVLPPACAAAAATAAAILLQTNFAPRPMALMPDLARISPLAGLSRILSANTLVQFLKSLCKLVLLALLLRAALLRLLPMLGTTMQWTAGTLLLRLLHESWRLVLALAGVQALLALADLFWVRRQYAARLRMSRQEQRDESKETDGNPQVKQKLRQVRFTRARRRMMQAVRKATVVVTNPEHYAVALAYERGSRAAPRLVAKGADEVAARIREEAYNHRVPIVSSPPLARALFRLELETEIPQEHFKAVAEIVAYVWRLQSRRPVL